MNIKYVYIQFIFYSVFQIAVVFSSLSAFSQDLVKLNEFEITAETFYCDPIGNIYSVFEQTISKYTPEGKLIASFNYANYGKIASLDVSNPFKALIYFSDFNRIIILNKELSPESDPLDLNFTPLEHAEHICWSYQNGMWAYIPNNDQLLRLNQQLKISSSVTNLNSNLGHNLIVQQMKEYNNKLYINHNNSQLLIFDLFGTYLKSVPFQNLSNFRIIGNSIFYLNQNDLILYDLKYHTAKSINLSSYKPKNIAVYHDTQNLILYLLEEKSLIKFSMQRTEE